MRTGPFALGLAFVIGIGGSAAFAGTTPVGAALARAIGNPGELASTAGRLAEAATLTAPAP